MSVDLSPMKDPQHIVVRYKPDDHQEIVGWFDGDTTADFFAEQWANETGLVHRVYATRSICKPDEQPPAPQKENGE